MSIAPIVQHVRVKAPPPRAFELFASKMGSWWPRGRTIGKAPHAEVVLEPRVDGRWYELDVDGNETQWGKVLVWDPPQRLLLAWQITTQWTFDPTLFTEVEVTFAPTDGGGTLVTLTHAHLERFGSDAASHSEKLRNGWPGMLGQFADLVHRTAQ